MKTILSYFILFFILLTQVVAQVPNSQRKKPVKKVKAKVEVPAPVIVAPVKEPSKEETQAWIIEKILKFKPIIYITGNLANKNNCEYPVVDVAFTTEDLLVLTLKSDPRDACYLDNLKQVTIDITQIDFKRTNSEVNSFSICHNF